MMRLRMAPAWTWIAVACLVVMLAPGTGPGIRAAPPPADMILMNGKVITLDPHSAIAQAVALRQGTFVAVGSDDDVHQYMGHATRVIDLRGRTVIPGLIDSHMHALRQGLTYDAELHWQTVSSLAQGLRMIRDRAARTPPGTWVVVAGGWHETQFAEARKPTRADIEGISSDHPIWVQHMYDDAIMNTVAIKALGLTAETPDPFLGKVLKDASGQPTGVVTGFGGVNTFYLKIPRPALDGQIASTRDWFRELNRLGLTGFGDVAGAGMFWPDNYQAVTALHDRRELTVRVRWYMQPNRPGGELDVIKRFVTAVRPGSGDDWFRPIGVGEQILASVYDGDRLLPLPPQFTQKALDEWRQAARIIIESGWRFQVHASHGHSAEQLLPAIEEINREIPVANRRLGFAHVEDVTPDTIRRIKVLGGGITVQDRLVYTGDDALRDLPEGVVRKAPPMKTMLAIGIPVGGGTDSTRTAPYNPFVSLWWIVTGKTVAGHVIRGPQEGLSRLQALRAYTLGSAWFNMDEDKVGSIEPGKFADLAVLSADYLTVPVDQIKDLVSVLTVVGGRPVYAAGEYKALAPR